MVMGEEESAVIAKHNFLQPVLQIPQRYRAGGLTTAPGEPRADALIPLHHQRR